MDIGSAVHGRIVWARDLTPGVAALLIAAGFAAGFINAVAGGGSAITLPILIDLLGGSVANGTNRIAVLLSNASATWGYSRGGAVKWKEIMPLIIPTVVGAIGGAGLASQVDADDMKRVFGVVLILVAFSVALKPSRWVTEREAALKEPWRSLAFLAIGFYGGFAQAGVGFLLLAGLVLGGGMTLVTGNAAKVVLQAAYTVAALVIFLGAAQVDVVYGLVLAIGNSSGAYVSSRMALREGATTWIRWVLVLAAVGAALRILFFS